MHGYLFDKAYKSINSLMALFSWRLSLSICLTCPLRWFSRSIRSRLFSESWIARDWVIRSTQYFSSSIALTRPSSWPRMIFARWVAFFFNFWFNIPIPYTPYTHLSICDLIISFARIFPTKLWLIARSACVVALDQCVRSDCVVTLTIRPHLDKLGVRPRPVPPFHAFSFSRGDFFKIEWAETGLGRASSKEEAVGMKCKFNIEPRVICYR